MHIAPAHSAIESAPAHIAATRVIAFADVFAPALLAAPVIRTPPRRPGRQAGPLVEPDQRHQPRVRHQILLVEHDEDG
ncbi:hypothetical protein ACFVW1_44950 [Streptomyces olivochromogenes]|uniref:hypothetical protein n=1 Tax=Streptomyces olivochromogenes TaxID=1963 RepID=UPI0036DF3CF3